MRGEFRPGEVRHLFSDSSKLRSTGWSPEVTVPQGVARYVDWIETQGDVREYFSEAEKVMKEMKAVRSVE